MHKKIDIYDRKTGQYICSTNWSKTCREAVARCCAAYQTTPDKIKATFAKGGK